ncbi:MAG: hypothetical protein LBT70_04025 [Holosporaceae bacterium]|nr:hypothetical protein [Holosporaceae bacterium]
MYETSATGEQLHISYLNKKGALRQAFSQTAINITPFVATVEEEEEGIDGNVWENFVLVNRYLGGAELINGQSVGINNGLPTPNISVFINAPYDNNNLYYNDNFNASATYENFIGEHTAELIQGLALNEGIGNSPQERMLHGMKILREFINESFPNLANVLLHISENDIRKSDNSNNLHVLGNDVPPILDLFNGVNAKIGRLGITESSLNNYFGGDSNNIVRAVQEVLNHNSAATDGVLTMTSNDFVTSTSFGLSPHISAKFGCYFPEIGGCLYGKVGLIQLSVHIATIVRNHTIENEKFNKTTPFVALGATKSIAENMFVTLEVSHAFKTGKKLGDIRIVTSTIDRKVGISKTELRVMLVYKF